MVADPILLKRSGIKTKKNRRASAHVEIHDAAQP